MNRLSLTLGLVAMDLCWVMPWAILLGVWTEPSRPRALLSPPSVFAALLLGALTTQSLGRRAASNRAARYGLVSLGVLAVLVIVRLDQYPQTSGVEWLALLVRAVAAFIGQPSAPALAFALGLFGWWRGVRIGAQMPSFSDVESVFRWGIGWLVAFALLMAVSMGSTIEAQTTPFVVAFFFVSLLTLALGRLESLRSRTRALAVNTQWLGLLVLVAGLVVLAALVLGQLLSFDLLIVVTRPIFDVLGQILLLAMYVVVIPLAYIVEWLIYLLLSLLPAATNRQPPQLLQTSQVDSRLQQLFSQGIPPELLAALKAAGAALVVIAGLLAVARAASRWRRPSADADGTQEERDSVWESGRLRRALLALLHKLLRRSSLSTLPPSGVAPRGSEGRTTREVSSVRELYRQLLQLGESVGVRRATDTTPLEHLPALQQSLEPSDDVVHLTEAYVGVRYGDVSESGVDAESGRQRLERIRVRKSSEYG